ncbi:DUF6445 family protein [Erythrobacter sp. THAF29]|uniref:DUF6445 family protein n=1 Tax=Erythrobacter sp. THAF29 TaxID=2587851 RepID=UPI0012A8A9CF|nr:DUF6445 family protein [Erythrobacter sp. THAF29]QFT77330.1 hypothetical protein FIU90_07220 [Erythrobacter sp. THAF29]
MKIRPNSISSARQSAFSSENHTFLEVGDFLEDPESAVDRASLQKFAKITPQYPGIRAPLENDVAAEWVNALSPLLDSAFGPAPNEWAIQAWYSIVTTAPEDLIPVQCFPHVDGTDPDQLAMMLYLDETDHGGTAFFRHLSTGFSALTDATYPRYAHALQAEVREAGLPPARYVTDGGPHFERIHAASGAFNQAVFYRGNILHSGIIDNEAQLSPDPRKGRLTINAFFRPL